MMLPVALQTAAQSRFSRMQGTRWETSRSDRQASAQAVQVSTALKHASMQRLIASECAGFSGWERNMARTATADMACSFSTPEAKQAHVQLVPNVINRCQISGNGTQVRPEQSQRNFCDSRSPARDEAASDLKDL